MEPGEAEREQRTLASLAFLSASLLAALTATSWLFFLAAFFCALVRGTWRGRKQSGGRTGDDGAEQKSQRKADRERGGGVSAAMGGEGTDGWGRGRSVFVDVVFGGDVSQELVKRVVVRLEVRLETPRGSAWLLRGAETRDWLPLV